MTSSSPTTTTVLDPATAEQMAPKLNINDLITSDFLKKVDELKAKNSLQSSTLNLLALQP